MTLMSEALRIHAKALNAAAGQRVTYIRGLTRIEGVTAVWTETKLSEAPTEAEIRVVSQMRDALVDSSELLVDGEKIEPERGDILETEAGEKYEVMPGTNEQHWHWLDVEQVKYRIHTLKR